MTPIIAAPGVEAHPAPASGAVVSSRKRGNMKRLLLAAAAVLAMSASAMAGTMNLMLDQDSGAFTQTFFGAPNQSTFNATNASFGNFNIVNITGSTTPTTSAPILLTSNTLDVQTTTTTSHVLQVWISANDLTSPIGLIDFFSGLTNVALSDGWAVTLETLVSTTNQMFAGTQLATDTFIGGTLPTVFASNFSDLFDVGAGPYSLTAHYTILTDGLGQANSGITIAGTETPLPAAVWMFGSGLAGLGALLRRRKKKQAVPLAA